MVIHIATLHEGNPHYHIGGNPYYYISANSNYLENIVTQLNKEILWAHTI